MERARKALERVAQERGISMEMLCAEVDIAIADAVHTAIVTGNQDAIAFWREVYEENGCIRAEAVVMKICEMIQTCEGISQDGKHISC